MKYWIFAVLSIAFAIALAIVEKKRNYQIALVLKALASVSFLILAVLSFRLASDPFKTFILLGLFFGAIGDVLLNMRHKGGGSMVFFYIGGAFFFIGHICHLIEYLPMTGKYLIPAIVFGVAIAIALILFEFTFTKAEKTLRIAATAYLITVSLMATSAFAVGLNKSFALPYLLRAIGGALFLISDGVLFFRMMKGGRHDLLAFIVLLTYYPAQCLIAGSLQF